MGRGLKGADDEVVALRCVEQDGAHVLPLETADATTDTRHSDGLHAQNGCLLPHGLEGLLQGVQTGICAGAHLGEEVVEGVGTLVLVIVDADGETASENNEVPLAGPDVLVFSLRELLGNLGGEPTSHGTHHVDPVGDGITGNHQGVGV